MKGMLIGVLTIVLATHSVADERWEMLLESQLLEASLTEHQRFSFTQIVTGEDGEEISTFAPSANPQWALTSINGEAPSKKEVKKFYKSKAKEAERNEESGFADLIAEGSVEFKAKDADKIIVSFIPVLQDMPDKALAFMNGEATFNAADERLQSLRIYSSEPFSPAFSVKIEAMNISFNFEQQLGQTLPKTYQFAFKGKVAGVKSFDVDSVVAYSEFERVVTP